MEYSKEYDDYKSIPCDCGHTSKFHLDELRARTSNLNQFLGFLLSASFMCIVVYLAIFGLESYIVVDGFLFLPFFIYGVIRKQEQNNVASWNRTKIGGRS